MQYVASHRALGETLLAAGNARAALDHFEAARKYPENLGEGKHLLTLERDLDYLSGLAMRMLGDLTEASRYWESAAVKLPAIGVSSYYQALALRELGREEEAEAVFAALVEFANDQMRKEIKIDYFATSLPNLLLFDDDLIRRNRNEMMFLVALGNLGLGAEEPAVRQLQIVLREDPNHLLAAEVLRGLPRAVKTAEAIERGDPQC
jgi:tetratricopeptide (TPR) repeat protein